MTGRLEVVSAGPLATLQDLGRPGWRRWGVPKSGALQPDWLRIANRLVNQPDGAAAIEFFVTGPTLKAAAGPLRLGFAGDFAITLERANGERSAVQPWRSLTLLTGDTVRIGALRTARAGYIAAAGLRLPRVLGSAATYTRAQIGGLHGRALAAGDCLEAGDGSETADRLEAADGPAANPAPMQAAALRAERQLTPPPAPDFSPIRVVPGPQADHFSAAVLAAFFAADYQVSADADRMGLRLQGPALVHRSDAPDKGAEIVSDATVPGSIQVPGNGQPIVLLADGQTAGGYPKIGTVASADLPRLALAAIGSTLRFEAVTVAQAEALARQHEAAVQRLLARIGPLRMDAGIDLDAIYAHNLVSGMIDARDPGDLA